MEKQRDRVRRTAETAEQRSKRLKKWRERDHARHTAQTVSERQATSQWKSTGERGAETPDEREMRNGSSATWHFEGGDKDVMELPSISTLSHIYYSFIPVLSLPKRDWIQ